MIKENSTYSELNQFDFDEEFISTVNYTLERFECGDLGFSGGEVELTHPERVDLIWTDPLVVNWYLGEVTTYDLWRHSRTPWLDIKKG